MDKEELIDNLKGHQKQTESFGWKVGISGAIMFLVVFVLISAEPFDSCNFDNNIIAMAILMVFMILLLIIGARHEKITDEKYKMLCSCCGKRHDHSLLPIAVLENQCQECGAKIYDS